MLIFILIMRVMIFTPSRKLTFNNFGGSTELLTGFTCQSQAFQGQLESRDIVSWLREGNPNWQ
jgi:hypothetical protein